ncbi:MAG: O-antigen ligase family protein [Alphaproteobacteria bacterium]|uniref:O-antigen ligase family protein n=1 Tax=Bradyrhizobium sp. TaxID=376 RepID=UPI001ED4E7B6|nr:O-antigen ligase family protein [Bradyrhizobium sp.]MBV9570814.1 O-antigen ligase family protein [Alphaproteobacteria bacterium]MBV9979065.1 O-antigen ligase family protein [Bradyrhizobium sp.]
MNTLSFTAPELWRIPQRASPRSADAVAELCFVVFLLLIFIGLKPFAIRNLAALAPGDSGDGAGNIWRQVCYLATFAAIVTSAWRCRGLSAFRALPITLVLLLGWCLVTSFWAPTPGVSLRRAVLEIVITLSAVLGVQTIGAERSLILLRNVLGAVLIINFASIPLIHQAVHLPGEADPGLIGNWRGLYYHKNVAGAVSAITALLFFFEALSRRRAMLWLLFAGAVVFTIMTRSKTSIGLLPVAVTAGLLFRWTARHSMERWIVLLAGGALLAGAGLAVIVDFSAVTRFFTDPTEFTGRVEIWRAELAFIRDHPLLGAGFGSFADTGALSPLYNYVSDKWVQGISHGHNGYLQVLMTIGGIGFALAMLAFIVQPALGLRQADRHGNRNFFAPLCAIFVFSVLHNFVESDFLESDGPAWVAFLLMIGCLASITNVCAEPATRRATWNVP